MSPWCETCGEINLTNHQCAPLWSVKIPDWFGVEVFQVRAWDAEKAAEKAVEEREDDDELAQRESSVDVWILENGYWVQFSVSAKFVVHYQVVRNG